MSKNNFIKKKRKLILINVVIIRRVRSVSTLRDSFKGLSVPLEARKKKKEKKNKYNYNNRNKNGNKKKINNKERNKWK